MSRPHKNWRVKTKLRRRHFRCGECLVAHTVVDEDGCCVNCGVDAKEENCYCSKSDRRRKEGRVPALKGKT